MHGLGKSSIDCKIEALRNDGSKSKFDEKGNYTFSIEPIAWWAMQKLTDNEYEALEKELEPRPMFSDGVAASQFIANTFKMR